MLVRGRDLAPALDGLAGEDQALLAIGRPVCPACRLVPASLAAVAEARPGLAMVICDMAAPEDWAVREAVLWPRGIRVSPASVPVLVLLRRGEVVASRQGGAPAHLLDAWIAGHLGPAARPVPEGITDAEQEVLAATAGRRVQHGVVKGV